MQGGRRREGESSLSRAPVGAGLLWYSLPIKGPTSHPKHRSALPVHSNSDSAITIRLLRDVFRFVSVSPVAFKRKTSQVILDARHHAVPTPPENGIGDHFVHLSGSNPTADFGLQQRPGPPTPYMPARARSALLYRNPSTAPTTHFGTHHPTTPTFGNQSFAVHRDSQPHSNLSSFTSPPPPPHVLTSPSATAPLPRQVYEAAL